LKRQPADSCSSARIQLRNCRPTGKGALFSAAENGRPSHGGEQHELPEEGVHDVVQTGFQTPVAESDQIVPQIQQLDENRDGDRRG
jgi:hypothetical protein